MRWRCGPLHEPNREVTDTSCRTLREVPAFAGAPLGSRGPIHRQRTTAAASWSEVPSAGRSLPTASTCVKSCQMGRHWSLGLAASVQLPVCVHPRASELGPTPEPVIHRSAKGHIPPDDFYNDVDAGARPTKLRPRAHGEPYVWVTGPCGTASRTLAAQGWREHEARSTLSMAPVYAPEDFPRPVRCTNTRCRSPVPTSAWKTRRPAVQQRCVAPCGAAHEPSVVGQLQSPHARET